MFTFASDCYARKNPVVDIEEYDVNDPEVISLLVQGKDPKSKCEILVKKVNVCFI